MASKPKHPPGPAMKSRIVKRSIKIVGRQTSVSLEDEFWNALKKIAITQEISLGDLVLKIDNNRGDRGLSSAIRVYVRNYSGERGAKT
jgi:predicted DNA-binding ribbon-helix-helix protein